MPWSGSIYDVYGGLISSSMIVTTITAGQAGTPLLMIWNSSGQLTYVSSQWDAAQTYACGNTILGSDCHIYKSQQSGNLNHQPVGDNGTWWVRQDWTFIDGEVPTGAVNGINLIFTLANTPASGTEKVFSDGVRMVHGVDYTISANTITFTDAAHSPSTSIVVDYKL